MPIVLGIITFILPCGFTQSMQIIALGTSSPYIGALALGAFSLGTLPVLLLAGISSSWSGTRKTPIFKRAAGLLLIRQEYLLSLRHFDIK